MADDETETPRPPAGAPPRSGRARSGLRDMALSMLVLAVGVLILVGITHGFSFSPGGPSDASAPVQAVDVSAELGAAASQVSFPLRKPALPSGWRPNSATVSAIGTGSAKAVRIGWLAPDGNYLQLSQSDATPTALAASTAGRPVAATGVTQVAGRNWTTYPGVRNEISWAVDLGPVRLFVTGNGTAGEFRTLAEAALTGSRVTAPGT